MLKSAQKQQRQQQQGITLIEILIAVAILLLLMLALFRAFGRDIDKARDAERKKDLQTVKQAFEDYYSDKGSYPPANALEDCDGDSLQPYLKSIPCDPTSGEPYLYLPLANGLGYRVLSRLNNLNDPAVAELNCQGGCGVPPESEAYPNAANYVYGVSEGRPVSDNNDYSPPETTLPPGYCQTHTCYCCLQANQDCSLWGGTGSCGSGPFTSTEACYAATACNPQ